jgi:hypothetical protein
MNYTLKLLDEYGIQAYMNRSGDSYQVLTGPYNRPEEVMAEMQRLRDIGVQAGFFIRHQPESVYDYKYAYQIRINAYSSIEQAQLLASQITNDLGVNARVVELTPGEFSVMTGQSSNWNQTRSIFNRIRNSPFETNAIIFTLEYI